MTSEQYVIITSIIISLAMHTTENMPLCVNVYCNKLFICSKTALTAVFKFCVVV